MPKRGKQGGKKNRAHGRKKRSASFMRYWAARRHLRGLRRHARFRPNDLVASRALEAKEIAPVTAGRDQAHVKLPGL